MKAFEETANPKCVKTVSEDGREWFVPLFEMDELGDPEGMLKRVRSVHAAHGQMDELARLDKAVSESGNPYRGCTIWPKPQN